MMMMSFICSYRNKIGAELHVYLEEAAACSWHLLTGLTCQSRGPGWRIHGSVEDTKLSTNKQHSLSCLPAVRTVRFIQVL